MLVLGFMLVREEWDKGGVVCFPFEYFVFCDVVDDFDLA